MWYAVRWPVACIGLTALLLIGAPGGSADEVRTHAVVQNAPPEIVAWTNDVDPRIGIFSYQLEARDSNGGEDLTRVVFRLTDAAGRVHMHENDAPERSGDRAHWSGDVAIHARPTDGPFEVTATVYDRHGANATETAEPTLVSGPLDDVRDLRKGLPSPKEERPPASAGRLLSPPSLMRLFGNAEVVPTGPVTGLLAGTIGAVALGSIALVRAKTARPRAPDLPLPTAKVGRILHRGRR